MTQQNIDDLLSTLKACKQSLPADTHPVHYKRLRDIEQHLRALRMMHLVMDWNDKKIKEEVTT
jgi:hypothetical protein